MEASQFIIIYMFYFERLIKINLSKKRSEHFYVQQFAIILLTLYIPDGFGKLSPILLILGKLSPA
jgi:hypothetical protein